MPQLLFRRLLREPLTKALRRKQRYHRAEIKAILADPKKLKALEDRIEGMVKSQGSQYLLTPGADEGRQRLGIFKYIIENWATIFQMIKDIISLFS